MDISPLGVPQFYVEQKGKHMTKFFVKKPYFVLVAVIIILIIGGVSLGNMSTDLMPNMEVPYLMVITTEPGASPNKVERDITEPMESTLGTVSGVEKVISNSANNYSMIMLQFADGTNMDSTLVRVSQKIEIIDLPDGCGKPNLMEVSMDMMATMYAGIDYKGKDIKELSDFTTNTLKPYLERQEGVASITPMGLTTDSIEVEGNDSTPCIVEVTASANLASVELTGMAYNQVSGETESIIIKNLKAGKKVVINGEDCTVLQEGVNKFADTEMWEFPVLKPGKNMVSCSSDKCTVTMKYKPKYV